MTSNLFSIRNTGLFIIITLLTIIMLHFKNELLDNIIIENISYYTIMNFNFSNRIMYSLLITFINIFIYKLLNRINIKLRLNYD